MGFQPERASMTTTRERLEAVLDQSGCVRANGCRCRASLQARSSSPGASSSTARAVLASSSKLLPCVSPTGRHFVGQLSAPPAASGDLFLVALALGALPTGDALSASARAAGAKVAVVSARPQKVVSADLLLHLPAQDHGRSHDERAEPWQPIRTRVVVVLRNLTVAELMLRLDRGNEDLAARPHRYLSDTASLCVFPLLMIA